MLPPTPIKVKMVKKKGRLDIGWRLAISATSRKGYFLLLQIHQLRITMGFTGKTDREVNKHILSTNCMTDTLLNTWSHLIFRQPWKMGIISPILQMRKLWLNLLSGEYRAETLFWPDMMSVRWSMNAENKVFWDQAKGKNRRPQRVWNSESDTRWIGRKDSNPRLVLQTPQRH